MKVSILLATYNSSRFIKDQLLSLIRQTFVDWELYIRDDGSTDNTVAIIEEFIQLDPRIHLLPADNLKLGAAVGFMHLLSQVQSDYYLFCDHDDYWMPDKIERSLSKMIETEASHQKDCPVLVHTDLYVVDAELNIIHSSYWQNAGIKPAVISSSDMIQVFNCVTGCTILMNERAKQVSLPYNTNAPMHDWWIAIQVKRNGGIIAQVKDPMIKYRQHGNNEVGAKAVDSSYYVKKLANLKDTVSLNLERMSFLRQIGGIGVFKYLFYKGYYNFIRRR